MSIQQMLFSFEGRIRRRDWWLWNIAIGVGAFLLFEGLGYALVGPQATSFGGVTTSGFTNTYSPELLVSIFARAALTIWPVLALAVKRGHDRDMATAVTVGLFLASMALGWAVMLLPVLAPGIEPMAAVAVTGMAGLIGLVINLFLLVVFGFLDGTKGPNRYGPSPKGHAGQAV